MRTITTAIACMVLAGCLPGLRDPSTGVPPNGSPPRVRYSRGTGSYVSQDVVAEDAIVNSNGEDTGLKVQRTAAVTHTYGWSNWQYFQGRQELDEKDYFRIAGDQQAVDEIARERRNGKIKAYIGFVPAVAGMAALLVVSVAYKGLPEDVSRDLLYGGLAAGVPGGLVLTWGVSQLKKKHHLSPERADRDAVIIEDCNEGRCRRAAGGGVTR